MLKKLCFLVLVAGLHFSALAQLSPQEIKIESEKVLRASLLEFSEFLQIPNNGNDPKQIEENLNWCQTQLENLGYQTQVLSSGGIPHLFAQAIANPAKKTVLVYMQIDGQPVDPSAWDQENPYLPVLKEKIEGGYSTIPWESLNGEINPDWKIFARSASDSKGPAMAFLTALKLLKEKGLEPSVNLKFILDFQEELSSPQLKTVVAVNPALFQSDGILIMDGTRHLSNLPNLSFGARGIVTATIKVFGARNDLHSGQYGNYAPNPVFHLARLIAAMKDEDGRVLIPDFYSGVSISEADQKAMAEVPEDPNTINVDLGIAQNEKVGNSYQESMQYPSLNVRGMRAAWVDEDVRTLIPSEAIAEIDMRIVKETPAERQAQMLKDFIESQGFHLTAGTKPTEMERRTYPKLASFHYKIGSMAFRADLESDFGKWLERGMQYVFDRFYVKTRQTGGSQPMAPFVNLLDVPAVSVRIPNPDNSIHAPNENIRIGNYQEGIQTCLSILLQEFE